MERDRDRLDDASEYEQLDITDEERIDRLKEYGYGGSVSDALHGEFGISDTVLSDRFTPLEAGMVLAGRALPVKLHSKVPTGDGDPLGDQGGEDEIHPQRRMMERIADSEDGTILCFDCGGDMQPAQFGELSCNLAEQQGCRGMMVAGNMRDTRYVLRMDDFPAYSFGTTPNAYGGWEITEVGEPIWLDGHITHNVAVHPGDFIYADRDGGQVVPEPIVDEVIRKVESIHEKEEGERDRIREGMTVEEVYEEFGVL